LNESFCLTANDFPVALAVVVALAWAQHQFVLLPPPAFFNDVKRPPGSPSDHELQSSPPARYSHLPGATKDRPGQCLAILFGPKDDGTYVVEFRTAGETLAICSDWRNYRHLGRVNEPKTTQIGTDQRLPARPISRWDAPPLTNQTRRGSHKRRGVKREAHRPHTEALGSSAQMRCVSC
jgi:hypothetical protein